MTVIERKELEVLNRALNTLPYGTPEWNKAYERYCHLSAKQHEEYKAANLEPLRKFYDKHIAGRSWSEIDPEAWEWYSDYHKDVFGYRPRTLEFPA